MSNILRSIRRDSTVLSGEHKAVLPSVCQRMSRKSGKHKHVSANTMTKTRLYHTETPDSLDWLTWLKKKYPKFYK